MGLYLHYEEGGGRGKLRKGWAYQEQTDEQGGRV